MLHALGVGDDERVPQWAGETLLQSLVPLLEQSLHAHARLGHGFFVELGEHLLESLDLPAGFVQMRGERVLELVVGRGLDELRESLRDLRLRAVNVAQLLQEQLPECGHMPRLLFDGFRSVASRTVSWSISMFADRIRSAGYSRIISPPSRRPGSWSRQRA